MDLARDTARATDEIPNRISAIQSDGTNAGVVIGQVGDIIEQNADYQTTVAAAVGANGHNKKTVRT